MYATLLIQNPLSVFAAFISYREEDWRSPIFKQPRYPVDYDKTQKAEYIRKKNAFTTAVSAFLESTKLWAAHDLDKTLSKPTVPRPEKIKVPLPPDHWGEFQANPWFVDFMLHIAISDHIMRVARRSISHGLTGTCEAHALAAEVFEFLAGGRSMVHIEPVPQVVNLKVNLMLAFTTHPISHFLSLVVFLNNVQ